MSRRARILRYGACIGVVLVGVACGALIPGSAGGTAATVLVGIGLVGVVSLIFYEIGLTEDRDRAREGERDRAREEERDRDREEERDRAREARGAQPRSEERPRPKHEEGRLRRIDRRRGQRRRLR